MEQSSNLLEVCFSEDKSFTTLAVGNEMTFDPDAETEVIGFYGRQETGSPSAVLVPVDAGKCAILGFDIEITYSDIELVPKVSEPEKLVDPLSKTVIIRDEYFSYVLSKLLSCH
jgi:hypothetical protein